jgi:ferric-dicitrate binding protein FerR (iron transport regulator)
MVSLTRLSVLRGSLGFAAASALARPHVVSAAATTVEAWWNQGYLPEEDVV